VSAPRTEFQLRRSRPRASRLHQRRQQVATHQFVQGKSIGDGAGGTLRRPDRRVRQVLQPGVGVEREALDAEQIASADFVPRLEVTLPGAGEQLNVLSPHVVVLFLGLHATAGTATREGC
jgi:hypothetical protein